MQFGFSFDIESEIVCAEELRTAAETSTNDRLAMNDNEIKERGDKKGFLGKGIPLKEGVRDLLIKHHLFSWDL